ncbi:MAG: hypothetical protein ACK452_09215 [Bacteroidota bacterium]
MKKVFLFATAAAFAATVLVSCGGPSEAEKKALEDSLTKIMNEATKNLENTMNQAGDSLNKAVEKAAETATENAGEKATEKAAEKTENK